MKENASPAVELHNVTKTFKDITAVNKLSLSIPRGSIYGFIGPNGSGKTTTLRMIMNIYYPDTGTVNVFGKQPGKFYRDRIGYLPEERGLYRKMKVLSLLRFLGNLKNAENVNKEAAYWLEKLGLSKWAKRKVETLSKGMSRKLQFIAAVVAKPEMVILDEPFSGLDPVNVDSIRNVILELRAQGTTVIFSTHDMNTAEKMCDYIFMIFKGEKVLDGSLSSIRGKYGNDTIRVGIDGDPAVLNHIPGVENVTDFGRCHELRMKRGGDSHEILKNIVSKTRVRKFELTTPSLHDIFVRIAGTEDKEQDDE